MTSLHKECGKGCPFTVIANRGKDMNYTNRHCHSHFGLILIYNYNLYLSKVYNFYFFRLVENLILNLEWR